MKLLALAFLSVTVAGCSLTQPQKSAAFVLSLTASQSSYGSGEALVGELRNDSPETVYLFESGGYTHVEKQVGSEWTGVRPLIAGRYYRWDSLAPGARRLYEIDRERLTSMIETVLGMYRFEVVVVSDDGVYPFGDTHPDDFESVTSAPFEVTE